MLVKAILMSNFDYINSGNTCWHDFDICCYFDISIYGDRVLKRYENKMTGKQLGDNADVNVIFVVCMMIIN